LRNAQGLRRYNPGKCNENAEDCGGVLEQDQERCWIPAARCRLDKWQLSALLLE
jgi:hypothetical protein